jgi:C-terminal processing protease CtpA/Prc
VGLVPNGNFGRLLETDMSGLVLVSHEGGVLVSRVAEESPAMEAGVRQGDRLIALDGKPAAQLSLEAIRAMLIEHGATRLLEVEREGRIFSIPILLRRRI